MKLNNRKQAGKLLSTVLESLVIPPSLVQTITRADVDEAYHEFLVSHHRGGYLQHHLSGRACPWSATISGRACLWSATISGRVCLWLVLFLLTYSFILLLMSTQTQLPSSLHSIPALIHAVPTAIQPPLYSSMQAQLSSKLDFLSSQHLPPSAAARRDVQPELDRLRHAALGRVRAFLLKEFQELSQIRSNVALLQNTRLLPLKHLMKFVVSRACCR